MSIITDESNKNNNNKNFINIFDICCNLEESSFSFFENHTNNNDLLYLFEYISNEIENKLKNKSYQENQESQGG